MIFLFCLDKLFVMVLLPVILDWQVAKILGPWWVSNERPPRLQRAYLPTELHRPQLINDPLSLSFHTHFLLNTLLFVSMFVPYKRPEQGLDIHMQISNVNTDSLTRHRRSFQITLYKVVVLNSLQIEIWSNHFPSFLDLVCHDKSLLRAERRYLYSLITYAHD